MYIHYFTFFRYKNITEFWLGDAACVPMMIKILLNFIMLIDKRLK